MRLYSFLIIIIFNFLFSQGLITNPTKSYLFDKEIESLKNKIIQNELFLYPFLEKEPSTYNHINILKQMDLDKIIIIEPLLSVRIGMGKSFEMFDNSSNALWLTPGLKFRSTIPLVNDIKSVWLYSWTNFYKHSSTFDNLSSSNINLFNYNPEYSASFYSQSIEPENSIDFDQSEAGIAILSNNFEIIFGKFNTSFGPSHRGNLSISNNSPPFEQFLFRMRHEKVTFSYLIGSLDSNIPKNNFFLKDSLYVNQWILSNNSDNLLSNLLSGDIFQSYERYVAYHRIDFILNENIRFGFYEQILFGARNIPLSYIIPVLPFWSSQHDSGDLDNLFIGLDFDIIYGEKRNKNNRIYASLLIDEWAPYSTFSNNNRNWFAYQLGLSKVSQLFNRDILYKLEYTKIGARVYNHRFLINEPMHHGYNLGYWSGNHSDDLLMLLVIPIMKDRYVKLSYESTRFSNATYDERMELLQKQYNNIKIDFLEFGYKYRGKTSISYSMLLKYNVFLDIELSSFNTSSLYLEDDFIDFTLKFRYNISK